MSAPGITGGDKPSTYSLKIDLLGKIKEFPSDNNGRLRTKVTLSSTNGKVGLSLAEKTKVSDRNGKPLKDIKIAVNPNPSPISQNSSIIGAVYDLSPPGITFDPPLRLALSYDPRELPQTQRKADIFIAFYENGMWQTIPYKQIDSERDIVYTHIDHSGSFAILAPEEKTGPESTTRSPDKLYVVYFHRKNRCASCIYAENGVRYTLETYFSDELASGKIVFQVLNLEDKKNTEIVKRYGAFASSLFINAVTDGVSEIREVKDIWLLVGKDEAFVKTVKLSIERAPQE